MNTEYSTIEWRPVPGYPLYDVSNLGRVRSWNRSGTGGRRDAPRPLNGANDKDGYRIVGLSNADGLKKLRTHRLVLFAFIGPPSDEQECCHENGVRDDNRLSNLRWDTPTSNQADRRRHGTHHEGEGSTRSKLTRASVIEIMASSESHASLARRFGVSTRTVSGVRHGQTWRHVTGLAQDPAAG